MTRIETNVTAGTSPERQLVHVEGMNFSVINNRLSLLVRKAGKTIECFVSSLIVIVADARDNSSSCWGKIVRFVDRDGVQKQLYLRNSEIATNGSAIIKAMVEEGLQVSTDSRMMDALLHYLNLAAPLEREKAICTDRIGWHGNIYLFPDNSVIGKGDTRVVYTGAPLGNHHTTKGTKDDWRDKVAVLCRGNSMLILTICVAFASVLLRLLKVESGGYHFYGESSTGKSTTLYVGASVHGEPEHLMGSWRSTTNGAEGKAKKCNDALMINDELHQSNPKEAGEAAYMIMNGKGKQRANVLGEAREVFEWRLNCLSSGEVAYSAYIQEGGKSSRGGQLVRMLDISADMGASMGIFENIHDMKDSHTFAELLKKSCSNYYGTPIRAFLEELVGNIERLEPDFARIKERFFRDFVPADSDSQVQRVATKLAVAALAGELATGMNITGWQENEAYAAVGSSFTRWLGDRGTTGQIEAEKAIEQTKNFLLRHGTSRFIPLMADIHGRYVLSHPDRPYTNMAGYRLTTRDGKYEFMVFPDIFKTEMCQGLNAQYVTKTLVEREYLKVEPDGKAQVRRRLPGIDQIRIYHFNPSIFDEADEFETEDEETEEQQ